MEESHSTNKGKPYAELWVGDHDSAPCSVVACRRKCVVMLTATDSGQNIQVLETVDHPVESCGTSLEKTERKRLSELYRSMGLQIYGHEIEGPSILFKVLSVAKPLSMQIHPDKKSAMRMRKQGHPSIVDSQDKPEMCVAVSRFRLLCGFRPLSETLVYARRYESFAKLIGEELLVIISTDTEPNSSDTYVRICHRLLMGQPNVELIDELIGAIKGRDNHDLSEEVLLTLRDIHGVDICILFAFLLNAVELNVGESCFIPPNTLHSYISGDCIELMNNSDNVIRCGLTKKPKDVRAVIELLEFERDNGNPLCQTAYYVKPYQVSPHINIYRPLHPTSNLATWSFFVPSRTRVSQCFRNDKQPFIGVILETNDSVTIGFSNEAGQVMGSEKKLDIVHVEYGQAFLIYPDTTMDVNNEGTTDVVFYFGTVM